MVIETKACSCCDEQKPLERFGTYRARKTGKEYQANQCMDCANRKSREYRGARPEIVKGWDSKKYQKGQPEALARQKRYYVANRDIIREKSKEYRLRKGDHLRAKARERGKRLAQIPEWREKDRIRARVARYALKVEVLEAYGGAVCRCCSETCIEMLTLDHINNDGAKHRKSSDFGGVSTRMYRWARKNNYPQIFDVMCYNCNISRAKTPNNICPHQMGILKLVNA